MKIAVSCLLALALLACNDADAPDDAPDDTVTTSCAAPDARPSCPADPPSYQREIIPLLQAKCNNCHDGTQGLWPLTDHQSVVDWLGQIERDIMSCAMPPADSPQLTVEETNTLLAWLVCGAPRDPVDAGSSRIGSACVPDSEQQPGHAGAAVTEVVLESSATCGDDICLSNHFQGRVTCPYGQTEAEAAELAAASPARCRLPDASGVLTENPVEVAVAPQLVDRRAESVVTCSCQCDGPTPRDDYCSCPAGTECVLLVEDFAQGVGDSYCIKTGTAYRAASSTPVPCDKTSTDPATHCGGGDARRNP